MLQVRRPEGVRRNALERNARWVPTQRNWHEHRWRSALNGTSSIATELSPWWGSWAIHRIDHKRSVGLMWAFGGFIAKSFSLKMRKIAKCHSFYPIYILICGRNVVSCQFAYQSVSIQLALLCSWVMVRRNYIFSILQQRCNNYLNYASFYVKKLTYRLDFIFLTHKSNL